MDTLITSIYLYEVMLGHTINNNYPATIERPRYRVICSTSSTFFLETVRSLISLGTPYLLIPSLKKECLCLREKKKKIKL